MVGWCTAKGASNLLDVFSFSLGEVKLLLLLKKLLKKACVESEWFKKDSFRQNAFLATKLTLVFDVLLISKKSKGFLVFFFHATLLLVQSLLHNSVSS